MSVENNSVESLLEGRELSFDEFRKVVLNDYRVACESRQASILARREVLTGKAKFGITGDGKEIAQIAMAKVFKNGDFRSGYYRDQTFMLAAGMITIKQYFAQLYADTDLEHDPSSAGRLMNSHFASRSLNGDGSWKALSGMKNSASDISCTAGQMPRLLGLAFASKLYRINPELHDLSDFSANGDEVAFGTIGNASTSEGHSFETINAAGVMQVPMLLSVWDDGYGISVPNEYHTTKASISAALEGFRRDEKNEGFEIFTVKGWDYPALCEVYEEAVRICRQEHVPVIIHVEEMTQPQGHSSSGSHERYKPKERLQWEKEYDPILKMREWMLRSAIAVPEDIEEIEKNAKQSVRQAQKEAWNEYITPVKKELREAGVLLKEIGADNPVVKEIYNELSATVDPLYRDIVHAVRRTLAVTAGKPAPAKQRLLAWYRAQEELIRDRWNSFLFTDSSESALNVPVVAPQYAENSRMVDGREVLNACFDANFAKDPKLLAFGEDVGLIGDVNQGFAGLQRKYGELRIFDTGIRETTIIGQGIGLALRGLRPIAEIQYLDYLLFGLQTLSDDLASLSYRTKGGQKAPLIIRTRGHRLEGIWHSGSPLGMIINSLRGIHVLVPRNMTQAAGFYNTLLRCDEPALLIESLNGYRLKERMPSNIADFTVPLGVPEVVREGSDVSIVTYGSCCRIAEEAAAWLGDAGISAEIIDVQSLLPFDIHHTIAGSLKKTNKVLFLDEDVPGGASAYMMQKVLEEQGGYFFLDSAPRTLTAKDHRPPYGSDGDYFSKPSPDDVFEAVYNMMHESAPSKYPALL
ncbi:pyruvate/2-oxoglutarate/acetoin dehydrogenase E1 component [Anseongella ginsenosidimutans]|uniref:3-methyl-2-oxobutanoate dehydrogenase (2-methylpropanoyl-transferring) n=1 Tax=Anseongella ginsenosidimutans TaxID=496056 RepID=A0A4R3KMP7_9SPHI|nr:alpha-ketoacid dehydrogenase subunit alpha/beta [Anseongella ginsenosidimutans]QEC52511.1 transketolase [Anseongella ginsenosidimutans]TCS85307.1 pyruvate/2-oxoglutarate/acetoin dehydrogenase E1 component [Anseongella ginsenosidimutans]